MTVFFKNNLHIDTLDYNNFICSRRCMCVFHVGKKSFDSIFNTPLHIDISMTTYRSIISRKVRMKVFILQQRPGLHCYILRYYIL